MQQRMFLVILSLLLISGCSSFKKPIAVETKIIKERITIQPRPSKINLSKVEFNVVTKEILEDFLTKIKENDSFVFYAVDVKTYENMSLNLAEIRRYIGQQKELIIYYETQIKNIK